MDSLIAEIFVFLKLNQSLDSATDLDEQKVIDKKADAAKPIYEKIEENFDKFEWNETYIQMVFNVCDIYETCCIMNYRLKCSEKIIGTMEKLAQVAKKLELEELSKFLYSRTLSSKSILYYKKKDPIKCLKASEQLLKMHPGNFSVLMNLCKVSNELGQHEACKKYLYLGEKWMHENNASAKDRAMFYTIKAETCHGEEKIKAFTEAKKMNIEAGATTSLIYKLENAILNLTMKLDKQFTEKERTDLIERCVNNVTRCIKSNGESSPLTIGSISTLLNMIFKFGKQKHYKEIIVINLRKAFEFILDIEDRENIDPETFIGLISCVKALEIAERIGPVFSRAITHVTEKLKVKFF